MKKCACYFLDKLPDLILSKYQALQESDVSGLLGLQKFFIRQWVAVCGLYNMTMHLLISHNSEKPKGKNLDVCVAFCGENSALNAVDQLLKGSSLREYFPLLKDERKEKLLAELRFSFACTLTKRERKLLSRDDGASRQAGSGLSIYFVPSWEMNEEGRLVDMIRMMEFLPGDSAYRVDIFPKPLAEMTRERFAKPISGLRELTGVFDRERIVLADHIPSRRRDQNADDALRQFEDWIEKIETTPHFQANIYSFGKELAQAKLLLHSAASEALEKGEYSVLDISFNGGKNIAPVSAERNGEPASNLFPMRFGVFHGLPLEGEAKATSFKSMEFPERIDFWPTSFTYEEIAVFFRLPALYEGEVIQLPKETAADPEAGELLLGKDASGHKVHFPLPKLNKHAFICGVPGGGKTNTMLHLTSTLWKQFGIPFLVFEPAKKEYRTLLNDPGMSNVMLFSPNAGTLLPIAINPFEFAKGLTLSEHISALIQVFSGAFEVMGPVRYYLNKAIENAYYHLGWRDETINTGELDYPVLSDVMNIYKTEVETSSYDGELKGNLTSFLQVRLGGLMTRELDEIFNVPVSSLRPESWMKFPAVIELESLEQEACNFFILLLCTLIRETLKASPNEPAKHGLRHVIFIEEAHNLIAPQTEQQSQDTVNPKISATAFIVKMLAEVRALKEGIVIADQLPSAIAPEVMKNTGLKIVHRMTAQDDRNIVGSTMSATEAQLEHLGTYMPGDALVFYEGLRLPFKGRIEPWGDRKFSPDPKDNAGLSCVMMGNENYVSMMENTVDSLALKICSAKTKIDDEMFFLMKEIKDLSHNIAAIDPSQGSDLTVKISAVEEDYDLVSASALACRELIFRIMDDAEKLKLRFPMFKRTVERLESDILEKYRRLKRYDSDLVELAKKIERATL